MDNDDIVAGGFWVEGFWVVVYGLSFNV